MSTIVTERAVITGRVTWRSLAARDLVVGMRMRSGNVVSTIVAMSESYIFLARFGVRGTTAIAMPHANHMRSKQYRIMHRGDDAVLFMGEVERHRQEGS